MKSVLRLSAVLVGFVLTGVGCAHHPDVRASADGVHRVVITSEDAEEGQREAIRQANSFCKERNLTAAFVNESSKYSGDMEEGNYKNAKRATKAAQILGGSTYVLGGKKESAVGGIVGLGGAVGDSVLGKAYNTEMKFKCM